jgi:hypothetical protein
MMESPVLNGWAMIAEYVKVHERTVMEWEEDHGFPVARVNGYVMTTRGLVELWIMKNLKNPKIRGLNSRKNLPSKQLTKK